MMKLFIQKICVVGIVVLLFHYVAALFAGGKIDELYLKFASREQSSMLIGTSIAAISIVPAKINSSKLSKIYSLPIYNFGLTIGHSKYGPVYLDLIERKLNKNTKNGLYILHVDPWSLGAHKSNKADDVEKFIENKRIELNSVNGMAGANIEYLIKYYPKGWGNLILERFSDSPYYTHEDGWLEVIPKNFTKSSKQVVAEELEDYQNILDNEKFSPNRFKYLQLTINMLKKHGDVFLVRVPKPKRMRDLSDKFMPDFNEKIHKLAEENDIPYFDLYKKNYNYASYDGNHLVKKDAEEFTIDLVDEIFETNCKENVKISCNAQ